MRSRAWAVAGQAGDVMPARLAALTPLLRSIEELVAATASLHMIQRCSHALRPAHALTASC